MTYSGGQWTSSGQAGTVSGSYAGTGPFGGGAGTGGGMAGNPPIMALGSGSASCSVSYEARIVPVRLVFSGVVNAKTDKRLITGQEFGAQVVFDGTPPPSLEYHYTWSVGTWTSPYGFYYASNSLGLLTPYTPQDQASTSCYFRSTGNNLIQCSVSIPAYNISFTVQDYVGVVGPSVRTANVLVGQFYLGYFSGSAFVEDPINAVWMKFLNPGKPGGFSMLGRVVDPPAPFTDGVTVFGQWNYTQLLRPDVWLEDSSGSKEYGPHNYQWGLDGSFPYPVIGGPFPANNPQIYESFRDSPAIGLTPTQQTPNPVRAHYEAPFELYLMYLPPGGGSTWTPRLLISWSVDGEAVKGAQGWSFVRRSGLLGSTVSYPSHPQWTFAH